MNAIEALEEAQKIAFAPFVFQATVSLRKLGIFGYIFDQRQNGGTTVEEISKKLSVEFLWRGRAFRDCANLQYCMQK